jgi:hypothetical protein
MWNERRPHLLHKVCDLVWRRPVLCWEVDISHDSSYSIFASNLKWERQRERLYTGHQGAEIIKNLPKLPVPFPVLPMVIYL